MVEALANLRREIDALVAAIRLEPGANLTSQQLLDRIRALLLTWLTTLKPQLDASKVPPEVLGVADSAFMKVVGLTGHPSARTTYLARLRTLRKVLVDQVLLEVARLPPISAAAVTVQQLLPEISDVTNDLIPNALLGWVTNMRKFLITHPFDRNVFVMVAYRARLAPLIDRVKQELQRLGLNGIVARDHRITDDLNNPIACLLCCSYGVAIFDRAETAQMHNPNVVYELGMMQLLKRSCVILKNRQLRKMPTDLLTRLYEDYGNVNEAITKLQAWWTTINA